MPNASQQCWSFAAPISRPAHFIEHSAAGRWGVRVSGLRARYPGAFEDALHLPELSVRAGELVALQGVSGAGKTTALRVLAGLPAQLTGVGQTRRWLWQSGLVRVG